MSATTSSVANGQGAAELVRSGRDAVTPCFTPGTLIATLRGELPVEHLRVGDQVVTRDNGVRPIRWIGSTHLFAQDFQANSHLMPVMIRQGALGKDLPEKDLLVSPNHRILVSNDRSTVSTSDPEVLIAAKHLTAGHAVTSIKSSGTSYLHFMCDKHEVVLSNGAWTESFQPEDSTLKGMRNAQRLEIFELFPALATSEGRAAMPSARTTVGTGAKAFLAP